MKILLIALNSKYIHSNLAVYSIKAYAEKAFRDETEGGVDYEDTEIEIAEYTINQPLQKILMDIYQKEADVLFFSCYIWNRREIQLLTSDMAKIRPELDIWLGGPEVSYDSEETLETMEGVKGIIRGEGERKFYDIVREYSHDGKACDHVLKNISGITFRREDNTIVAVSEGVPMDFNSIPFSYEDPALFKNRIIYYESSRGCPFMCSYCLSSIDRSMRLKNFDKVEHELRFFLDNKVPQVKFIDRTFNCNHEHALRIWKFLKDNDNGITNFHFEIAADLLMEDELKVLSSMRPGQVQLEIGVQSVNRETLKEIHRNMDFDKVRRAVKEIKKNSNIHLHLDLIAGLPFENMESFAHSFNEVFSLRPEQLQLGFLKVLKGTAMKEKSREYGLEYTEVQPYEVLRTNWMSYAELIKLKRIEDMVEVYYNSGQFTETIELLLGSFDNAFELFDTLSEWYRDENLDMINLSRNQRYENLLRFGKCYIDEDRLMEKLIYDYYLRENVKSRPEFLGEETVSRAEAKLFYDREGEEHRYLTGKKYGDADSRRLRKLTHLEKLGGVYYLFDYMERNSMTGNAKVFRLD